jgi:alpha-glucosidase (family GH31 glycosyl hydrolase)
VRLIAVAVMAMGALAAATSGAQAVVVADAGALKADVSLIPWSLKLVDGDGGFVLQEDASTDADPAGTIGFSSDGRWWHAARVRRDDRVNGGYRAELTTNDPAGRRIDLQLNPAADGVIQLDAQVQGPGPPIDAVGIGFEAQRNERFLGFGERSQAVDQRGNVVENYVADGPYQRSEWPLIEGIVPPWGFRPREDATYYPLPWLLSTAGYGVLVDGSDTSYFRLDQGGSWSVEVTKAPPDEVPPATTPDVDSISMRFFAGPKPADVLRRFTAVEGRQPPAPAPWVFGPWVQPNGGTDEQLALLDQLQQADAPMSVAQTYLHYLPCGDQRGRRAEEQARTGAVHQRGLAITTYINPMVCADYHPVFDQAAASGGLIENMLGEPYLFQYSTNTSFQVAEFDFTSLGGRDGFASVIDEAIGDGHDGWMEDFGEYTPLDSQTQPGGIPGTVEHNRYPTEYHCAASNAAAAAGRPIARFQRSGFLGSAPCATVVWGGDPTTAWDFDGLRSAVRQALTMGLSGISTWGSDIGGFFALFQNELTPELLTRWVQFGAVSGVMRTEADGIAVPDKPRPQVWDADQIDNWRRYAKLHTQLYPYLAAAEREYQRSGLPLMRQLALVRPEDGIAAGRDDEFMFGPDLLAAPVLEPGATERSLYLPQGRWVDLWRSVKYGESDGALRMRRAELVRGAGDITVPAPLDELPLLARAGTVLPLLPADVDTLTDYPSASTTSLDERAGRLSLLAFPRAKSSAQMFDGESIKSRERGKGWVLKVKGQQRRTYRLQASLKTLKQPFKPCAVGLGGKPLRGNAWGYDRKQKRLQATLKGKRLRLVVRRRCG